MASYQWFLTSMKLYYVLKESCFARSHHCSLEGLSKSFPLELCDPNHFRVLWLLHATCTSWDRSSSACTHCCHRRMVAGDSPHHPLHFLSVSSQFQLLWHFLPLLLLSEKKRWMQGYLCKWIHLRCTSKDLFKSCHRNCPYTLIPSVSNYWDLHIFHYIIKNS